MKMRSFLLGLLFLIGVAGVAGAEVYTFSLQPPGTGDLQDLDHYRFYVWDFYAFNNADGVGSGIFSGKSGNVVSAKLTFQSMWNSTNNTSDKLSVHLLADGSAGVDYLDANKPAWRTGATAYNASKTMELDVFRDADGSPDAFLQSYWGDQTELFRWYNVGNYPASSPPADRVIPVTSGTAKTLTYDFTPEQIAALNNYILSGGEFALGFDPDCHYYNRGVRLDLVTVPEASAALTFAAGLAGLIAYRRKKRLLQG